MSEHLFFDCNASFGAFPYKHREARWTRDHLLEDLELAGIAGALTYHRQAVHYDPMRGNLRLIEEIKEHRDTLFPCWIALPSFGPEFPSVPEFMAQMKAHDVRAVRLHPARFGIPVRERIWAELRDALLEENILCIVPTEATPADEVHKLLQLFAYNNTVLLDMSWPTWRAVMALMDEFPNLHLEFSTFQANRAIEFCAERYGVGRCLFGTGLPDKAPGAARGFLDWTLMSPEDAGRVAGGNLKGLLGNIGPTEIPAPGPWHDSITAAARAGQPLPCPVLDAHCHMLHDNGVAAGGACVFVRGDAASMIELTRRTGIDKTAIMSWAGPLSLDTDTGNEIVASAVRQFPDEFVGLLTINPEYDDEARIEELIQHYHVELGFPGLKTFTPLQTIDHDDPLYHRWLQFANDHKLYMVFDPKGATAATPCAHNLATRYPDLGIHLDHCGQSWDYAKWGVGLMKKYPNIWAQLNYTAVTNGTIEYIVGEVGAERVLFGTDSPMRDPRPQASWLTYTRLTEEQKRLVFGGNFARILANVRL